MKCNKEDCYVPRTMCGEGFTDYTQCSHFEGNVEKEKTLGTPVPEDGKGLVPWVGSALGSRDLSFVTARAQCFTIGIIGAQNSGKTTFLAALYLLLAHGRTIANRSFAGSYTLGGWETLAHGLRWHSHVPPNFPAHTESNTSRDPGFLHMALGGSGTPARDLLFADAPGEWFQRWSINADDERAQGAIAVQAAADAFIFVVDSKALEEPQTRGEARGIILALAQRLSDVIDERPLAVLWSKADAVVPKTVQARLEDAIIRFLPQSRQFRFSVLLGAPSDSNPDTAVPQVVSWLLESANSRNHVSLASGRERGIDDGITDPFFLFGNRA